jgi:Mrp family chromosome partitioning ATPase
MRLADAILLVTRPGNTAKRQLQRALEAIEQPKLLGALINGSKEAAQGDYYHYYTGKTAVPQPAGKMINPNQASRTAS